METILLLVMVYILFVEAQLIVGVHSIVRKEIFPGYPEPEFVGVNGGGGFVLAKDLPPNIPPEIKDASNFIFGKPGFFGVAPASDGVISTIVNPSDK